MSPLKVEAFDPSKNQWVRVHEVMPHDPPGSLSNNLPDGRREVYVLGCQDDDSGSIICRSKVGVDILAGTGSPFRRLTNPELEVVKELKRGESQEMEIKTDINPVLAKVRFTHI